MRFFDVLLSALALVTALPLLVVLLILGFIDTGSPIFRQVRVGRDGVPFTMLKLRTMRVTAVSVPTHIANPGDITSYGRFLRRSKLDEIPQLWNVLRGEMSLVGPRPCLFSQQELIDARRRLGVHKARPGITGVAQLSGIDMSTPLLLAETEALMLGTLDLPMYFRLILRTALGAGRGDRVRHGRCGESQDRSRPPSK